MKKYTKAEVKKAIAIFLDIHIVPNFFDKEDLEMCIGEKFSAKEFEVFKNWVKRISNFDDFISNEMREYYERYRHGE